MSDQINADLTAYFRGQDKADARTARLAEFYDDAMQTLRHECKVEITLDGNGAVSMYRGDDLVDDVWLDECQDVRGWITGKLEQMANDAAIKACETAHFDGDL